MKTYNGHRSWNAWNVSLWIGNLEILHSFAMECLNHPRVSRDKRGIAHATRLFMKLMGNEKTPDGAVYNTLPVRLALEGFIENE